MNYGEVLGRAWKILWRYKNLWLVWIFPYLIYSITSTIMTLFNLSSISEIQSDPNNLFNPQWMQPVTFILSILFMLVYMFLSVYSNAANAVAVVQAERGVERIPLPSLIKDTYPYYWRVLGFLMIYSLAFFTIFIVFIGCLMGVSLITAGMAMICIFPLFILLIPVTMVIYGLVDLSKTAIIAENIGILEGFKHGWAILKPNFWKILLMSLILYGGTSILMMILFIPMYLVIFIPMFSSISMNTIDSFVNNTANMQRIMAYMSPIYTLISGMLYSYMRFVWTLTYLRLSQSPIPPKPALVLNA